MAKVINLDERRNFKSQLQIAKREKEMRQRRIDRLIKYAESLNWGNNEQNSD